MARAGLSLQGMCKGGFVLGIGAGEAESIHPFGYDWRTPVGNLERALIEIRSLLDTGRMPAGSGRTGLPRDNVPDVWVAAMKPRALRLTGRYADGWMPIGTGPDDYAEQLAVVTAAADEAGRPAPEASVLYPALFGTSRDQIGALLDELPVFKLIALFGSAELWRATASSIRAGRTVAARWTSSPTISTPPLCGRSRRGSRSSSSRTSC